MAITFDQFFQSIVQQESGGNYKAVGPPTQYGRAYGKYQVLESNIGPWTAQYYGQRLTAQQFLNNRAAQDAVARGKLKSYWDKYGARGAASAWYSGNPNLHNSTRSVPGGPSIKQYVDSVINRAGGLPASGGGSQVTATVTGGGAPKVADRSELAEQYGFVEAVFASVPELRSLFDRAVKGGWTSAKFQAELRNTKWYKSKPESARKFLIKQAADPATARQEREVMYRKVKTLAAQMGSPTDPAHIQRIAISALMNGWDEGTLRYEVGRWIKLKGDQRYGEAGEAYDKLASYAYDMGIGLVDSWADNAARNIVSGMSTQQEYEDRIRQMAKAKFPSWAKQIDAGQSVADLASPYFQSMATILEVPPGSVNLFDPTIAKALQYKDPKTGKGAIKPLWQFENDLRSDERWKKTKNAQDSSMQIAHQVLSDFGLVF